MFHKTMTSDIGMGVFPVALTFGVVPRPNFSIGSREYTVALSMIVFVRSLVFIAIWIGVYTVSVFLIQPEFPIITIPVGIAKYPLTMELVFQELTLISISIGEG